MVESGSFSWALEANLFSATGGMNKEACSQVESGTNPTAFPSIVSEENLEWDFYTLSTGPFRMIPFRTLLSLFCLFFCFDSKFQLYDGVMHLILI